MLFEMLLVPGQTDAATEDETDRLETRVRQLDVWNEISRHTEGNRCCAEGMLWAEWIQLVSTPGRGRHGDGSSIVQVRI